MKHLKRWLSSLLILCMTILMLPMTALAETTEVASGTCGENLIWVLDDNGTLTISGTGDITSSPWPSENVKEVIIENGVSMIGDNTFDWHTKLTSITIPGSVIRIGNYAFDRCESLSSVTIPEGVISVGSAAFRNCSSLRSISIASSVTNIGSSAFECCDSLTDIWVDSSNPCYSSDGNRVMFNKEGTVLILASRAISGNYTVPNGVITIGEDAFWNCDNIVSVTLPNTVTSIGADAFHGCDNLTTVGIPSSVTVIGGSAFYNCDSLSNVLLPTSVMDIGYYAFYDCDGLVDVDFASGVISIGIEAFYGCDNLESVEIPDSVTNIMNGAFSACTNLTGFWVDENNLYYSNDEYGVLFDKGKTELKYAPGALKERYMVPYGVMSIGTRAFSNCGSLTSVVIPYSVTKIKDQAFLGCGLTSVFMTNSVTSIGNSAFLGCTYLSEVFYSGTEEEWGELNVGYNNGPLTRAKIHYSSPLPDDESNGTTSETYVRHFSTWDAENQIAYFNGNTITGSQVTGETDTSFLENVDSLVGQYVLVETRLREDNMIAPDTLISIKPVETKTGTVTDADTDANTIAINDVTYDVNMSRFIESADGSISTELVDLSAYVDEFVLYHIYDGKIVGIETLKTTEGMLTYWNAETREIKISHEDRTTTTYTLSELADADTVALLGETGYFEFDVAYATDSNSFLYQITRTPVIDFAEGYVLTAYFDRRDLSVQRDDELEFVCVLYYDGLPQEDWNKPVFTTSNENVLSVTACEKTDSGYCLAVKGGQPGTATVTVTDANSGAYVDFNVEVREAGVLTYSYLIDEVPSFYPDVLGDRDTQTNFYNVNGLYVNGFPEATYKFDGKYRLSFTVYNSTNMYGSVDVYDKNGNWYSSQRIDKHTSITGLWDTAKGAFFLLYDGMEGRFISYTAHSCSTPTEIDIEVPEGGYFTISNNFVESPGTYIYNTVDFMMIGVDMLTDLAFSSADTKVVQEQTVNQILQTPDAYETFLVSFKDIAQDMVKEVTKQGYGDAVEAFTLSAFDMFDDMQFDFMGVVELACNSAGNVAEDIFEKCTPPAIGGTLKGMFAINKYLDRLYQVKDVYTSEDKPYIRLYTPEATGGLTISGITVAPTDGALPDNAVLQVFRIANTEALIVSDEGLVADQYELYNICFTVNNIETQPNGTVTVKIPVPANYNSEKCIVLHQQEDGNWRTVESKIEQGFIVFEVDHFCQFAVVDTNTTTEESTAGDINGDGKVNGKDGVLLAQYLAEWDVTINMDAADVNGDGKVNGKDGVLLAQYLAEWDVEIH